MPLLLLDLDDTLLDRTAAYARWARAVPSALAAARDAGWTPVVVTNGGTSQQERKLHATGLVDLVAGWVISETAGTGKPDPRIFREAARRAGQDLDGAWMVGDSAVADIGGAHRLGLRSAWVRRSRTWTITEYAPTLTAETGPEAIRAVLAHP